MKTLNLLLLSALFANAVSAQFSENFDQNISGLPGNCWSINNVNYTTTSQDVINGTGSAYTNPPTSSSGVRTITTPYLNVNSTSFTVSFNYKTSSKINGNSTRTIEIVLVALSGAVTSLQTLTMDNTTTTSVINHNNTYSLSTTGVYRLELRIGGATGDGNSRVIFDDLFASASAYYTNFCNPAATAVNDSYTTISISDVNGNVLTNDNIPADNDSYTAVLVSPPTVGTLVFNADGTFTYTPPAAYTGGTIAFSYQVNDNGYAPTSSNVAMVTINFPAPVILPMKVLDFDAAKEGNSVKISWKVSENETGDYFIVEKSSNGSQFSALTKVDNNGFKGVSEYFTFDNSNTGTSYYRIKIVNKDNSISYSKVVMVKDEQSNFEVKILNNPATASLNITYTAVKQTSTTLKLYSITGAQVYQVKLNVAEGTTNLSVPVQQLQNGSYVLVIDSTNGKKAIQFIKK